MILSYPFSTEASRLKFSYEFPYESLDHSLLFRKEKEIRANNDYIVIMSDKLMWLGWQLQVMLAC